MYHQSYSAPVGAYLAGSSLFQFSPLCCSYYYLLSCYCWLLMVSISLAMKRSTITSHSFPLVSCPLKVITYLANNQKTMAIAFGTLLLHGMTTSTKSSGASVLQRAMVGMLTYEASITACLSLFGSATIKSLGSWNFLVS